MNDSLPWRIEWHDSVDSTMLLAAEHAERGAPAGTVVVADFQQQGRGTRGRVWLAPPGTCLMFTALFRPDLRPACLETLPLRVATSIAKTLRDHTGIEVEVKPPNDITVRGRKLCGVLCTSRITGDRVDWVLCGIGLNTRMTADQLPFEGATSLAVEGIDPVPDHRELLPVVLDGLAWLHCED